MVVVVIEVLVVVVVVVVVRSHLPIFQIDVSVVVIDMTTEFCGSLYFL